jgi:dimethylamine monooxygenase subunit A
MNVLKDFPFPFTKPSYQYSNNSNQVFPPRCLTVTDKYKEEIELKRKLLAQHKERCYQSLPYSIEAQWEIMMVLMEELATNEPSCFSLERKGNEYRFVNHLLEEEETFIFRDMKTISLEPLDLVGRHTQEDLILMGDRDADLYLDAGQLCFPSNWSLCFTLGMDFKSIHFPVPGISENHFIDKVQRFIKQIRPGHTWERKNWSITIGSKLDTPLETYSEWGTRRLEVTAENAGELVHLRVEVQRLHRLPISNDVLFTIHTYLLPVKALEANREWLQLFYQNIKSLPADICEYKGIYMFQQPLLAYLENMFMKE